MAFKSVIPNTSNISPGSITLDAGSVLGNPGTVSASGTSVAVGSILQGGAHLDSKTSTLVGAAPTPYWLTLVPDATGIQSGGAPYYTASRYPSSLSEGTIQVSLTGTTITTIANFITNPGDPGSWAAASGFTQHYLCGFVDPSTPGTVHFVMQFFRRSFDGTETGIGGGTFTGSDFSTTAVAAQLVECQKFAATVMSPQDRIVFRIRVARVSGASPLLFNFVTDGTTNRSTVMSQNSGAGVTDVATLYPVRDYGAAADLQMLSVGTISAGGTIFTSSDLTAYGGATNALIGKSIEISDAITVGGPPLITTITGVSVQGGNTLTVASPATLSTGVQYVSSFAVAVSDTATRAGSYIPGTDTVALDPTVGTYTTQAVSLVSATLVDTIAINNAGSLGTDGSVILTGTTGVGDFFRATATILGGVVTALGDITFQGYYTTNPTSLSAEPVVATNADSGASNPLAGCTLTVTMGVAAANVSVAGSYTVTATNPIATAAASSSGATGALYNVSWTASGRSAIYTNNLTALTNAFNQANTWAAAGKKAVISLPPGGIGYSGGSLPNLTQAVEIVGAGSGMTQIYNAGDSLETGIAKFQWTQGTGIQSQPNTDFNLFQYGSGVRGVSLAGNSNATTPPNGIMYYGFFWYSICDDVRFDNLGAAISTGNLAQTSDGGAGLSESYFGRLWAYGCGTTATPVLDFTTTGRNAPVNNTQFGNVNIIRPQNGATRFRVLGATSKTDINGKSTNFDYLRVEYPTSFAVAPTSDVIEIGTADQVFGYNGNISIQTLRLTSVPSGIAGVGFYGGATTGRPSGVTIRDYGTAGSTRGNLMNIVAGSRLAVNFSKGSSANPNKIVVGNRASNGLAGVLTTGSTTTAIVLSNGSATTDIYKGARLILGSVAKGTASYSGSVMTVTAVDGTNPGTFRVGMIVASSGIGANVTIASLGTGTGGTGTYNLSRSVSTLGARAVTASIYQSREITAWNGSTKTATVSPAFSWAPLSSPSPSDTVKIQNIITAPIFITTDGVASDLAFTLGTNNASTISTLMYPTGTPGGTLTVQETVGFAQPVGVVGASGTVSLSAAGATGSYTFGLPAAAGTAGQVLRSGGGGTMTFTTGTLTLAGNLTTVGASPLTITTTGTTSLTVPTSGTVLSSATATAANPVTGTPSATTYLRGDGTWTNPGGKITTYTVSNTHTFDPASTTFNVTIIGGGGGGGGGSVVASSGSGGGGGGGASITPYKGLLVSDFASTATITIANGGTAGAAGASGGFGGQSTFVANSKTLIAWGGGGGRFGGSAADTGGGGAGSGFNSGATSSGVNGGAGGGFGAGSGGSGGAATDPTTTDGSAGGGGSSGTNGFPGAGAKALFGCGGGGSGGGFGSGTAAPAAGKGGSTNAAAQQGTYGGAGNAASWAGGGGGGGAGHFTLNATSNGRAGGAGGLPGGGGGGGSTVLTGFTAAAGGAGGGGQIVIEEFK